MSSKKGDPSKKSQNDFDDDLGDILDMTDNDFGDGMFDIEGIDSEEDRSPAGKSETITTSLNHAGKNAAKGAVAGIKSHIEHDLPNASEFVGDSLSALGDLNIMKDEIIDQVTPMVKETKKLASRLLKQVDDVIPKSLSDRLQNFLTKSEENETSGTPKKEDVRKQAMESAISALFASQQENAAADRKVDLANRIEDQKLEQKRHRESSGILGAILNQASFHTAFLRSTYSAYIKKDLELKYRSIYLQEDLLDVTRIGTQMMEKKLDAIRHNTSLPDSQKIHLTEIMKRNFNEQMIGGFQNWTGNYIKKLTQNIREQWINPAMDMLGSINDIGDSVVSALEDDAEAGKKFNAKRSLIGWGSSWIGSKIGSSAMGKVIRKMDPRAKAMIEAMGASGMTGIQMYIDRIRRGEIDLADKDGNTGMLGSLLNMIANVAPELDRTGGSLLNDTFRNPSAPGAITKKFTTTVEEIIPGYLAEQTRYLQALAYKQDPNTIEKQVWSYSKNKFVTLSEGARDWDTMLFGDKARRASIISGHANSILGLVNKKKEHLANSKYKERDLAKFEKIEATANQIADELGKFIDNLVKRKDNDILNHMGTIEDIAKGVKMPSDDSWSKGAFYGLQHPRKVAEVIYAMYEAEEGGAVGMDYIQTIQTRILQGTREYADTHRAVMLKMQELGQTSVYQDKFFTMSKDGSKIQLRDDVYHNANKNVSKADLGDLSGSYDEWGNSAPQETAFSKAVDYLGSTQFKQDVRDFTSAALSRLDRAGSWVAKKLGIEKEYEEWKKSAGKQLEELKKFYDETRTSIGDKWFKLKGEGGKGVYFLLSKLGDKGQALADLIFATDKDGGRHIKPYISKEEIADWLARFEWLPTYLSELYEKSRTSPPHWAVLMCLPEPMYLIAVGDKAAMASFVRSQERHKAVSAYKAIAAAHEAVKENAGAAAPVFALEQGRYERAKLWQTYNSLDTPEARTTYLEEMRAKLEEKLERKRTAPRSVAAMRNAMALKNKNDPATKAKNARLARKGVDISKYGAGRLPRRRYALGGTIDPTTGERIGTVDQETTIAGGKATAGEHGVETIVPLNGGKDAKKAWYSTLLYHLFGKSPRDSANVSPEDEEALDEVVDGLKDKINNRNPRHVAQDGKTSVHATKSMFERLSATFKGEGNDGFRGTYYTVLHNQLETQKGMLYIMSGGNPADLKIISPGVIEGLKSAGARIFDKGSSLLKDAITGTWRLGTGMVSGAAKGAWGATKRVGGKALDIATSAGGFAGNFTRGLAVRYVDMYLPGGTEPIVTGAQLKAGEVAYQDGSKPLSSCTVRNALFYTDTPQNKALGRVGSVAVSSEQVPQLVDSKGRSLSKLSSKLGTVLNAATSNALGAVKWTGGKILDLGKMIGGGISGIASGVMGILGGPVLNALKGAGKALLAKKNPYRDIYTYNQKRETGKGSELGAPLATADDVKYGRLSFSDGGPVKTSYGITTPVIDKDGNTVITQEDIDAGLFTIGPNGHESLSKFAGRSLLGKLAMGTLGAGLNVGKFAARTAWKGVKLLGKSIGAIGRGIGDAMGITTDFLAKPIDTLKSLYKSRTYLNREDLEVVVGRRLDLMYAHMTGRPMPDITKDSVKTDTAKAQDNQKKGDTATLREWFRSKLSGSGALGRFSKRIDKLLSDKKIGDDTKKIILQDISNSYADIKESLSKDKDKDKSGGAFGKLRDLWNKFRGKDGEDGEDESRSLKDRLMDYLDFDKDEDGKRKRRGSGKGKAGKKAAKAAKMGSKVGKMGRVAQAARGAANVGSKAGLIARSGALVGRAALAAGSVAMSTGSAMLSSAGAILGPAASFIVSNPVGWAVGAALLAGAVGYGAYMLLKDSDKVKLWRKERMTAYGFPNGMGDEDTIDDFEEDVLEIIDGKRKAFTTAELDSWADEFGLHKGAEDTTLATKYFTTWYNKRFLPVYTAFATMIREATKAPLSEPDVDDLSDEQNEVLLKSFQSSTKKMIANDDIAMLVPTPEGLTKALAANMDLNTSDSKGRATAKEIEKERLDALKARAEAEGKEFVEPTGPSEYDSFRQFGAAAAKDLASDIKWAILNPFDAVQNFFESDGEAAFRAAYYGALGITPDDRARRKALDWLSEIQLVVYERTDSSKVTITNEDLDEFSSRLGLSLPEGSGSDAEKLSVAQYRGKIRKYLSEYIQKRFIPIWTVQYNLLRNLGDEDRGDELDVNDVPEEQYPRCVNALKQAERMGSQKVPEFKDLTPDRAGYLAWLDRTAAENGTDILDSSIAAKDELDPEAAKAMQDEMNKDKKGGLAGALTSFGQWVREKANNLISDLQSNGTNVAEDALIWVLNLGTKSLVNRIDEIRAKAYGFTMTQIPQMLTLERMESEVVAGNRDPLTEAELHALGHQFGIIPDVAGVTQEIYDATKKYFTTWYAKRFQVVFGYVIQIAAQILNTDPKKGFPDISGLTSDEKDRFIKSLDKAFQQFVSDTPDIIKYGCTKIALQKWLAGDAIDLGLLPDAAREKKIKEMQQKEAQAAAMAGRYATRKMNGGATTPTGSEKANGMDGGNSSTPSNAGNTNNNSSNNLITPTGSTSFMNGGSAGGGSSMGGGGMSSDAIMGGLNMASLAAAPIPDGGAGDLGAYVKQFESGKRGPSAIGYDSTGGTSYGSYQIASKTGTLKNFIEFVKGKGEFGAKLAESLSKAGALNTGSTKGAGPEVWKEFAKINSGETLRGYEHQFIKATHYDPALRGIKQADAKELISKDRGLQEALWSTSVQHGPGGASSIFNATFKPGITPADWLKAIYAKRGTKFGSSTPAVRKSVLDRFKRELPIILGLSGMAPSGDTGSTDATSSNGTSADSKNETIPTDGSALAPAANSAENTASAAGDASSSTSTTTDSTAASSSGMSTSSPSGSGMTASGPSGSGSSSDIEQMSNMTIANMSAASSSTTIPNNPHTAAVAATQSAATTDESIPVLKSIESILADIRDKFTSSTNSPTSNSSTSPITKDSKVSNSNNVAMNDLVSSLSAAVESGIRNGLPLDGLSEAIMTALEPLLSSSGGSSGRTVRPSTVTPTMSTLKKAYI